MRRERWRHRPRPRPSRAALSALIFAGGGADQDRIQYLHWLDIARQVYSRSASLREMGRDVASAGPDVISARWPPAAAASALEAAALAQRLDPAEMLRAHHPEGCPRKTWLRVALDVVVCGAAAPGPDADPAGASPAAEGGRRTADVRYPCHPTPRAGRAGRAGRAAGLYA